MKSVFQQQYLKIDNTREQLFHTWRSFHFNENTETLDSYVICIRQVATLLGYGKPQVIEVFKNTLQTRLCLVLFPIEDLRLAVETSKIILTKRTRKPDFFYCTADIMTETCDWAKNLESLPFIGTIFYLNWFTQNITYLITPFNIHMPIAEAINIAQRLAKI